MENIHYDILQFIWNAETNSFYADAWDLIANMPDGSVHPEAFPTMKGQFFIYNYMTNGFRRFRFVKETTSDVVDIDNEFNYSVTNWLFESEDGIKCHICIKP
jgi:hypothetical protein